MSESEHLATGLTLFLLDEENGWFASAFTALEDLSAPQAAQVPTERFNSVWSVVRHMTYWMRARLMRFKGEDPSLVLGEDWLPIPEPASESAWAKDKADLAEVTRELAEVVRGFSAEELSQTYREGHPQRWQEVMGIIAHNSYHTNEIISIRHMLGFWMEQT
jgi:uncharacterized damage-inducible protein DinB